MWTTTEEPPDRLIFRYRPVSHWFWAPILMLLHFMVMDGPVRSDSPSSAGLIYLLDRLNLSRTPLPALAFIFLVAGSLRPVTSLIADKGQQILTLSSRSPLSKQEETFPLGEVLTLKLEYTSSMRNRGTRVAIVLTSGKIKPVQFLFARDSMHEEIVERFRKFQFAARLRDRSARAQRSGEQGGPGADP
jgi:hypothetical protein